MSESSVPKTTGVPVVVVDGGGGGGDHDLITPLLLDTHNPSSLYMNDGISMPCATLEIFGIGGGDDDGGDDDESDFEPVCLRCLFPFSPISNLLLSLETILSQNMRYSSMLISIACQASDERLPKCASCSVISLHL